MGRREKKKIQKTHQSSNYDIISTIKKILTTQIQRLQKRPPKVTRVGHICCQRQVSHPPPLGVKCGILKSSLMTFLGVVEFISLNFFYSTNNVIIEVSMCF